MSTDAADLLIEMRCRLTATPTDVELADFCRELEIDAQPLFGRMST